MLIENLTQIVIIMSNLPLPYWIHRCIGQNCLYTRQSNGWLKWLRCEYAWGNLLWRPGLVHLMLMFYFPNNYVLETLERLTSLHFHFYWGIVLWLLSCWKGGLATWFLLWWISIYICVLYFFPPLKHSVSMSTREKIMTTPRKEKKREARREEKAEKAALLEKVIIGKTVLL